MTPFDKAEKVVDAPIEEQITPKPEPEVNRPAPEPPAQQQPLPHYGPDCCTMGRASLIQRAANLLNIL